MTRILLLLTMTFSMFASSSLRAQNQAPSIDSAMEVGRAGMRADRITIISTAMDFNQDDGAAFWPVYRQYEHERSMLEDGRMAVVKEYANNYPKLTDAEAKTMAERMFEYDARLAEIKKKYFKKFNKVLPALTVTKFFQLDRRIDLMADMNLESSLPPLTQASAPLTPSQETEPAK